MRYFRLVNNSGLQQDVAIGVNNLTYGTVITPDAEQGSYFAIVATDGTAFQIANALKPVAGQVVTFDIKNSSGGAMGALTWGAAYLLGGALTAPANTKRKTISFQYDGTNWVELSRVAADI